MKILALIPTLSAGGAERVLSNLVNDWCMRPGWQVRIVTLDGGGPPFYPINPRVSLHALDLHEATANVWGALRANWRRWHAVRKEIKKFRPDVAVGFMSQANILIALACFGRRTPSLGTEHIYPPMIPLGRTWEFLRRFVYAGLDGVLALTEESRQWLLQHTGARRCWVIPNAVPFPIPAQEPGQAPFSAGSTRKKRLLAVGRLAHQKGFDLLLQAFARLHPRHPQWELVIVGDGPLKDELRRLCLELGVADVVSLPGVVGNIGDWYASADLFVLSSRYEGFGNVLAEALAYGVPCVSFDCPHGPRDIIEHGLNGLLVEPESVDGLERAMDRLMSDAKLRVSMAAKAIEAREKFSIKRIHGSWDEVFAQILHPVSPMNSGPEAQP